MKNIGVIAILGGMGPQASAKLLQVIIDVAAKDFGARSDPDFPEVILNSVPVPNFVSDKKDIKTILKILKARVKNIENFNPACFAIACNTAHIMLDDLQKVTKVPFVSIIDEVAKTVDLAQVKRVGLLGTPVTIKSALYQKALDKQKIKVITPTKNEQAIVEKVIWNVLAGKIDDADRQSLLLVAESLGKRGAEGIILGCTELPLIFPKNSPLPVFDSIDILARALLMKAFSKGGEICQKDNLIEER